MQSNSDQQDYNKQNNNSSSEYIYPSYQGTPSSYSSFPQQSVDQTGYASSDNKPVNQTGLYQQNGIVTTPVYQSYWNNKFATPMTPDLKMFLCISGFIYSLWGISSFSIQLALVINSYSTYYHGFWTGTTYIIGGILMMIGACRLYYPLFRLIRIFIFNFIFSTIGLIFSIVNYTTSPQCYSSSSWYCDNSLGNHLKLILMIIFIMGLIHTIVNIYFITKEQRKTVLKSNPHVSNY